MDLHEVEVGLASSDDLKAGVVAAEVRKVLVAADSEREAVDIAIDMAWRDDRQVTYAWYVL